MTRGSHSKVALSGKGSLCRPQRPKCEKSSRLSGPRAESQFHYFRACLTFCLKDQAMMEERDPLVGCQVEGTEERLIELTKKWFLDTQVPLMVQNGLFPTWFRGFITRKDAEKILRDKELGCFLIRLSNKSIGYILSYKGRDRCRHFLINQSQSGQFLVYGDHRVHNTVPELVQYYKTSPIQPFGERLTTSCFEALSEELYDVVQVSQEEKPASAVRNSVLELAPSRPPRSSSTLAEEAPPLPQRRSRNLDGGLLSSQDGVLYAQLRKKAPKRTPYNCQKKILEHKQGRLATQGAGSPGKTYGHRPAAPQTVYSKLGLLDSKSRSMPMLDREQSYRLRASPATPPRRSPRPVSQVYDYDRRPEWLDPCGSGGSSSSSSRGSWENVGNGAVYYLAGRPGSTHTTRASEQQQQQQQQQHEDSVYTEVTHVGAREPTHLEDDSSNTYEPVEDVRPKHKSSSRVSKNEKWKWLFPKTERK